MRFLPGLLLLVLPLGGQTCVQPQPLPAGGVARGVLDERNCRMSDGAFYAEYSVIVPQVGRLEVHSDARVVLRDSAGRKADARYLEPGEYLAVVYGAGDYQISTEFFPEPGFLCRAFRRVAPGAEISGTLGESSCRTPAGAPFDAFDVRSVVAGTLDTPDAILRDTDGLPVPPQISAQEDYRVVVTGEPGPYKIKTAFQPTEGDACVPRRFEGTATGTLSFSSCRDHSSFYDVYSIDVAEPGAVELRFTTDAWNPGVALLAENGEMLASGRETLTAHLRPGRYLGIVSTTSPVSSRYTLSAQVRPGPPATCPVLNFPANSSIAGTLSPTGCRVREGIADIYRLSLDTAATIDVSFASGEVDGFLMLRDERDNLLWFADGEENDAALAAHLPAGTYSVAAGTPGGGGRYELRSQVAPKPVPECSRRPGIELNGGYIGLLGEESCRGAGGRPVDRYEFTLPQAGTVAVFMTAADVDSQITLEDESGRPLRRDDNSYGERDAMLVQYLPAGKYRLSAAAADQSTGLYRVDVLFGPGERPAGCSPVRTLEPGNRIQGILHVHSCQYTDGSFADIYRIEIAEPAERTIEMNAALFETQLLLLDGKGNLLDKEDSRIARAFEPGLYFVIAKSAGDYTAVGAYTLTMR